MKEISNREPLSPAHFGYFRERVRLAFWEYVVLTFMEQANSSNLTKAELARRIGRRPEQVGRWLAAPTNWTLDTATDLLLGMGIELMPSGRSLMERPAVNYVHAFDGLRLGRDQPAADGVTSTASGSGNLGMRFQPAP